MRLLGHIMYVDQCVSVGLISGTIAICSIGTGSLGLIAIPLRIRILTMMFDQFVENLHILGLIF